MKKFQVVAHVTISVFTDVEAGTEAQAREIAMDRPLIRLCMQCSAGDATARWVTSGELDGEPVVFGVEEAT